MTMWFVGLKIYRLLRIVTFGLIKERNQSLSRIYEQEEEVDENQRKLFKNF